MHLYTTDAGYFSSQVSDYHNMFGLPVVVSEFACYVSCSSPYKEGEARRTSRHRILNPARRSPSRTPPTSWVSPLTSLRRCMMIPLITSTSRPDNAVARRARLGHVRIFTTPHSQEHLADGLQTIRVVWGSAERGVAIWRGGCEPAHAPERTAHCVVSQK